MTRTYSIRKSRQILHALYKQYNRKKDQLTVKDSNDFEFQLQQLEMAITKEDRVEADQLAREVQEISQQHFKKSFGEYAKEITFAIFIAFIIATLVRQTWFELYEIPTGSMRPTFKEQDHLTVTKTAFGLNIPLKTNHFYFDPQLVQHTSIVIWSGDNIPHLDSDSTFMKIFPYTKRYIKRCMGKPGDSVYFYGGQIYGIDQEGNDLIELRNNPWMTKLDHVPFNHFEGRRSYSDKAGLKNNPVALFHHFNKSIGRFRFLPKSIQGEIFTGQEWVIDNPEAQRHPHEKIRTYSDFWGIRNFAMARLLTQKQLETFTSYPKESLQKGLLYLELRHTPSLSYPKPLLSDYLGAFIKGYTTVIPLQEEHIKALMATMYTCRFIVKNGYASSYRLDQQINTSTAPLFSHVPDGTYEFYYGKALQVDWGGITHELPPSHPLYSLQPEDVQLLFNVGIDMTTEVEPKREDQLFFPSRYVYFREGDLYAMGGIVMHKADPFLMHFHLQENVKESASTQQNPYVAFKDYGPPVKESGEIDKEFIKTFGFTIPKEQYLVLGDNHAMSLDSRYFGSIPQANLQGAPSLIIWPPGNRWGAPNQKPYPIFNIPRLIVWSLAASILLICYFVNRRKMNRPLFIKTDKQ
jgi:signal peptidase I